MQNNNTVSNLAKKEQFRKPLPHFEWLQRKKNHLFSFWFCLPGTKCGNISPASRRQGYTYFASKAKAMMPATMGADTEVPVWPSVQRCRRSVVTCGERSCSPCTAGDAPGAGATPSSTPGLLRMLPAGSRACRYPTPAMAPTPSGCSEPQKMGCRYVWRMRKHPRLHFPLLKGAKTI